MDFKDTCEIILDKGTTKVKCYKFKDNLIGRELALHEDVDCKNYTSVTDVKTGLRLFGIKENSKNINQAKVQEGLENFVRHYSLETIQEKFVKLDKEPSVIGKKRNGK